MNDYITWSKFLTDDSVIIMHDVVAFKGVRSVFQEINLPKMFFSHSAGLGVLSKNAELISLINKEFK